MAGRASGIKEQVLGLEVFDRGHDFNPRLDPIVRVQARNLRSRMAKYYEGPGKYDPIRFELPKGTYIPVFHEVNPVNGEAGAEPAPALPAEAPRAASAGQEPHVPAPVALKASDSVMPAPPPRSPVAGKPQLRPRFMVASLILMGILVVLAVVLITRTHAATSTPPGPLSGAVSITGSQPGSQPGSQVRTTRHAEKSPPFSLANR
jgi:hypothetical protein